jgi:hypothetical protein
MKISEKILELAEATTVIKSPDGKDREVEIIKKSKSNLAVVLASESKGVGRFAIFVKKGGKKVSPLYKAEEIKGNDYRERNPAWGDSVYYKFDSEDEAKKEAEKLKDIYPKFDFNTEEDTTSNIYSVTHLPTGYAVLKSRIKSHALSALKEIEKLGNIFPDSTNPKEVTAAIMKDEDIKNKLMLIMRQYHMRAK